MVLLSQKWHPTETSQTRLKTQTKVTGTYYMQKNACSIILPRVSTGNLFCHLIIKQYTINTNF